jgi:hypothetical protein
VKSLRQSFFGVYDLHKRTTCNIKFVSTLTPDWTVIPCISRKLIYDWDHSPSSEAFKLLQCQGIAPWFSRSNTTHFKSLEAFPFSHRSMVHGAGMLLEAKQATTQTSKSTQEEKIVVL